MSTMYVLESLGTGLLKTSLQVQDDDLPDKLTYP